MSKDDRFTIAETSTLPHGYTTLIIVDSVTGVNYLLVNGGYSASVTPLLDENGRVVVSWA
ncbi:MAG: DUF6440 family protein [Clostridiales Family XIII bacterium]|nr:DUF6440 family protein [Clostridiales Family XIII bacterium]